MRFVQAGLLGIPGLLGILVLPGLISVGCVGSDKAISTDTAVPTEGLAIDEDGDGYTVEQDCNDADPATSPAATELCDGIDNDCDGDIDEGVTTTWYVDSDGDGFGSMVETVESCAPADGLVSTGTDCDDADAAVYPAAAEACDGTDNDCDGAVDEDGTTPWYTDADGDGFGDPATELLACAQPDGMVSDSADCDDTTDAAYPGGVETCDGVDNDCDGEADQGLTTTYYRDVDGDGYGTLDDTLQACEPPSGYSDQTGDCDDTDAAFNPGADESDCTDPTDYNCDGSVQWADDDSDGYAACEECDDGDPAINPAATEVCDGTDNDCDGDTDDDDSNLDVGSASTFYIDADGDGYGTPDTTTRACSAPPGAVGDSTDCDDGAAAVNPGAAEVCNEIDDDCDCPGDTNGDGIECASGDDGVDDDDPSLDVASAATWYADDDGDGHGTPYDTLATCDAPSGYVSDDTDCDDTDAAVSPSAAEVCDGAIDENCDGLIDDDDPALDVSSTETWYTDGDGDGHGDSQGPQPACEAPSGTVALADDCDDTDAAVSPSAAEVCGDVDDDCDGLIDEDDPDLSDATTWFIDYDADGFGSSTYTAESCEIPSGYASTDDDCDDTDDVVNPDAEEVCNEIDDDCDCPGDTNGDGIECGSGDDGVDDADSDYVGTGAALWYLDADSDGEGDPAVSVSSCAAPSGYVDNDDDCDDSDATDTDGDGLQDCADDDRDGDGLRDDWDADPDDDAVVRGPTGGLGSEGDVTLSGTQQEWTLLSGAESAGDAEIDVDDSTLFVEGDELLLLSQQGVEAGTWQAVYVSLITGNRLSIEPVLEADYSDSSVVLVQRIPHYDDVEIPSGATLTGDDWGGAGGGVVVLRATGSVLIDGTLSADGLGLSGGDGVYGNSTDCTQGDSSEGAGASGDTSANGGGGGCYPARGDNGDSGGGGGFGTEGEGGTSYDGSTVTTGGETVGDAALSGWFLGAGGGGGSPDTESDGNGTGNYAGTGGDGGGLVVIWSATDITVAGRVSADGDDGDDGASDGGEVGAGGGGAGGQIYLVAPSVTLGGDISAIGGEGGSSASHEGLPYGSAFGGGGGDGRVRVDADSTTGSSEPGVGYTGAYTD